MQDTFAELKPGAEPDAPGSSMPTERIKFLGLAFAGADLAFEVDGAGSITFGLGAVEQIAGCEPAEIVGVDWCSLVSDDDAPMLKSLLGSLEPGERQGPFRVSLRPKRDGALTRLASLSVFRIPQNPDSLSCAISVGAPSQFSDLPRNARGLLDRATFDEASAVAIAQAHAAGQAVTLSLVQLQGLDESMAQQDAAAAEAARLEIGAMLRLASYGGMGAAEIARERYAFLHPVGASSGRLSGRLAEICGGGVRPLTIDLNVSGVPAQSLRAVRFALDRYAEAGAAVAAANFDAMLHETAESTARFHSTLAAGTFDLFYQPVVDLEYNVAHHYEALARFEGADSPQPTLRLAEEVGGIIDFDLMVVRKVLQTLKATPAPCRIAVNVSATSLMTPRCVDALLAAVAEQGALRSRLLFEITESQNLHDLERANRIIGKIRKTGHAVCLDDFGAGGASLQGLCRLEVDFVKIDGRYVTALDARSRDGVIARHVVALCRSLGVSAIAEMVETPQAAAAIQSFGVTLAQGWLYGKATPKPEWRTATAPVSQAARRIASAWG